MKVINSKIVNGKKMFLIEEPIKKLGGVIEDNQGQWKYPGQITKINSPNITMKGVNYPVLGISNTGHKQLMMPEQEYTFDGQSVTEYPITAQAGTTVKINKDNVVKEYDRRSPEYKAMYDSGRLMSYDKSTDTYRATPLETFEVKTKAPQWLIDKRNIEKNFTKEKFVKKYLPKWSGSMGETADNLSENAQKDYDKKVNDKLANVLLKSNQKKGNKEANNLDWYNSFSEKEREIIQQSSLANKFAPAQRAYDLDVSNSTKKYNTTDVLTDADKLSQSVQGTPERFRLFPNAENNIESYVNPGMFLGSMAKGLGNVPKDIKNENYGQAALSIATPLGVGALAGIGNPSIKQFINNIANPLAGTGDLVNNLGNKYLPNAYKLNPNAFKPNPEAYYRTLGKEGIDDAFNSGVIRPKQTSNIYSPELGKRVDVNVPEFPEGSYFNKSGLYSNNKMYNPDYIAEVVGKDNLFTYPERIVFNENIRVAPNNIPIEEANFYKKDWLKGYKEVPKPKENFKSEIDNIQFNISKLKSEKELYEKNYQSLVSKYKNKEITPEQYKIEYQKIAPENPYLIGDLEKQVRELKVKQDIFNTPQKNILTSETQLGKNISDGGSNNKGVFELGDNYVAKLSAHGYDDASRLVNYADKLTSPRIMKTHQVKEFNGKVYQVQDKATGIPYTQLSEQQLKNLPKNHIDNFYKDIAELEKNGLNIDISGGKSNIFYDSKKGFQFIDLGIGKMPNIDDINKVVNFKNPVGNFKSEVDWGKWNKEIPENKALMQEYNTIEQQAKADGTWMKNPDGTDFPGTPEQFVQQNSSNFKNAFGNTKVLVNGRPQILTHNSPDTFSEFSLNKVNNGRLSGDGVYTFEEGALWKGMPEHLKKVFRYPAKIDQSKYGKIEYHLYGNSTNPKIGKGQFDDITKDIVIDSPTSTRVINDINRKNIHVFPNTNQLKSAIGNNGMFDMTNPNIYKTLVGGLAIGTLGKQAMEKKEFGGKILNTKIENGKKYFLINE